MNEIDSNKLHTRLKEIFKERISQYREAVYLLTGYRLDLISDSSSSNTNPVMLLKLKSMYAESPEDDLFFQWTVREASLKLIDSDFASLLNPKYLHDLQTTNSVPYFLSNITLELYEKQTFMG